MWSLETLWKGGKGRKEGEGGEEEIGSKQERAQGKLEVSLQVLSSSQEIRKSNWEGRRREERGERGERRERREEREEREERGEKREERRERREKREERGERREGEETASWSSRAQQEIRVGGVDNPDRGERREWTEGESVSGREGTNWKDHRAEGGGMNLDGSRADNNEDSEKMTIG
jgi:hypothetical protein